MIPIVEVRYKDVHLLAVASGWPGLSAKNGARRTAATCRGAIRQTSGKLAGTDGVTSRSARCVAT